jgi:hypothetical protein
LWWIRLTIGWRFVDVKVETLASEALMIFQILNTLRLFTSFRGGTLRPKWREWPSRAIRRVLSERVAFGILPTALFEE